MKNNKLVTILGPTASGKTHLAIKLAKKYSGEIVCADSRTIYKSLDIGTAKPSESEQAEVPHHILDIISVDHSYSVGQFKKDAEVVISEIRARGKLPFLVGGSGLYIDSVLFDYGFRDRVESKYTFEQLKPLAMEEIVAIADREYPTEIETINIKNRRRVEQLIVKGPAKDEDRVELKNNPLVLGLSIKSPLLKQNIADRTKKMLNNKLIHEVEEIIAKYGQTSSVLQTTGYKQVVEFLNGNIKMADIEEAINNATWQLARKQMTWFRRNKHIKWIENETQADMLIDEYLKYTLK